MRIAAKWILPISSEPIKDGVLVTAGHCIAAVGRRSAFADVDQDFGNAIVMPGLVNAHTHLELSCLAPQPERGDLIDWIVEVLEQQQRLPAAALAEHIAEAVHRGVRQSLGCGVSTVGDISRFCALTRPLLRDGPLRVVSYGEVLAIGTRRHLLAERLRTAADTTSASPFLTIALSPHAPYSIEGQGIKDVVNHARIHHMRTAIHLAETVEEIQFLQAGRGRFRELLERIGAWDDAIPIPQATPIRYVCDLGSLGPECLAAHCNYLDEEEIDLLCATGTSVAYCPRSHQRFRHQTYPLLDLIGGGVNVCVGTDSLASAPSLSVVDELNCVHTQYPDLSADVILAMGTLNGARALGMAQWIGSLEPGKKADFAVFACARPDDDPQTLLLRDTPPLQALYIDGAAVAT